MNLLNIDQVLRKGYPYIINAYQNTGSLEVIEKTGKEYSIVDLEGCTTFLENNKVQKDKLIDYIAELTNADNNIHFILLGLPPEFLKDEAFKNTITVAVKDESDFISRFSKEKIKATDEEISVFIDVYKYQIDYLKTNNINNIIYLEENEFLSDVIEFLINNN